jgi:hypothetical protein
VRDAGVPRPDYLCARDFAVAAEASRHDLKCPNVAVDEQN